MRSTHEGSREVDADGAPVLAERDVGEGVEAYQARVVTEVGERHGGRSRGAAGHLTYAGRHYAPASPGGGPTNSFSEPSVVTKHIQADEATSRCTVANANLNTKLHMFVREHVGHSK